MTRKLEFYLKGRTEVAQLTGFESVDDVPRNSTFWRAYADTDSNGPCLNEDVDEEDKKYSRWVEFVTDIAPVTADRDRLARQFRNHWGAETQYRQFKHKFYAPTKSPKGSVRAFHFNIARLFYNIWVVVNLELRDRYGLVERRPVTADDVLHAIRDEAFELEDLPE